LSAKCADAACWLCWCHLASFRYWTLAEAKPQHWQAHENALPSDLRFRQDLAALAAGNLEQAQHYKEVLERQQRSDRKLRETAGVFEH
jgi:GAF domain-containing protein